MDYSVTKIVIATDDENLKQISRELIADEIANIGYETFEDTEEGVNAYIQTEAYDADALQAIIYDFPIEGVTLTFSSEEIPSEDWNAEWEQQGFEPIYVNSTNPANIGTTRRCIIYDAKSGNPSPDDETIDFAIAIDARMAFGTGTHETTQMIVTELLSNNVEGKLVLDCGCGTGILSLVAKKIGAKHVTAYDIDEWSVENTKHNAEINGIELLDILLGDVSVLSHVDGTFEIIMANINRNILLEDMPMMVETMTQDGVLILSGFYEEDIPMLLSKASTLGLYEISRRTMNGWAMLTLHR